MSPLKRFHHWLQNVIIHQIHCHLAQPTQSNPRQEGFNMFLATLLALFDYDDCNISNRALKTKAEEGQTNMSEEWIIA